jgi:ADP-ribose pyrophosphatase YjhB (NUDIX family)
MAIKTFHVGVKAVIKNDNGVLLIRHAQGWWDMPGGRLDDEETLEDALAREISEEIPGARLQSIESQLESARVFRKTGGEIGLLLVYYRVNVALPEKMSLSEEHSDCRWIKRGDVLPEPLDPVMARIVLETLEK